MSGVKPFYTDALWPWPGGKSDDPNGRLTYPLCNMKVYTAGDYDALAADLAQARARIEELVAMRPASLKQRVQELEAALRDAMCPAALVDNKDETVGYCVAHKQCGCSMRIALQSQTRDYTGSVTDSIDVPQSETPAKLTPMPWSNKVTLDDDDTSDAGPEHG